ncbi:uncharacterized protein LOC143076800 [Mytilus galloprovincialis]|uniref:uncharacterized protein LOC143076800 n=1 Tax=Mytilus galloprovincialis TaxID=29158 RepID=UPI003F7C5C69
MVRLYYASKDQFNRTKQILSRIENISYVCIGSNFMFGFLSFGGLDIKVRPELPIQLQDGMNAFSIIAMLWPVVCCISILSVKLFAEWKLPENICCSMYALFLMIPPLGSVILIAWAAMQDTSTMVMNRRYTDVLFFSMPIFDMSFLFYFLFSKCMCMESIERLHKTRDGRLHRKTGSEESVENVSTSQHDEEIRELVVLKDPNGQGDEEMDTDV